MPPLPREVWLGRRGVGLLLFAVAFAATACGGKVVVDGDPPGSGAALGLNPFVDDDPCGRNHVGVQGTLGGQPLRARYVGFGGTFGYEGCMQMTFGREGLYTLYGPGFAVDGAHATQEGWLRFPGDGYSPSGWYCTKEPGKVDIQGLEPPGDTSTIDFHWSSLRHVDACRGGAPVSGDLEVSDFGLSGDVDGHFVQNAFSGWSQSDASGDFILYEVEGCGYVGLSPTTPGRSFLLLPDDAGKPQLYCIGSVSSAGSEAYSLHGLTKVGGCADATLVEGELSVCDH